MFGEPRKQQPQDPNNSPPGTRPQELADAHEAHGRATRRHPLSPQPRASASAFASSSSDSHHKRANAGSSSFSSSSSSASQVCSVEGAGFDAGDATGKGLCRDSDEDWMGDGLRGSGDGRHGVSMSQNAMATLNPLAKNFVPQTSRNHWNRQAAPIVESGKVELQESSETSTPIASSEEHRQGDSFPNSGRRNRRGFRSGGLSAALNPTIPSASSNDSVESKSESIKSENNSSSHPKTIESNSKKATPGRKLKGAAVNANHLLNFQYQPIQRPFGKPNNYQRKQKKSAPQPFNKELFLQANFRFLVSDLGDYLLNLADPDRMLDWADVLLVEVSSPSPPQCPICLENSLLCPQITSCGHLFCFPCILQYLMQGIENRTPVFHHMQKCPLCFSSISTKDLRSASIHSITPPSVGNPIRFTLLMRSKSCILPYERSILSHPSLLHSTTFPYSSTGKCHPFAKFTLTGEQGARATESISTAELTSFAQSVEKRGGEDLLQLPFVFSAMDFLRERTRMWIEHRESDFISFSPPLQKRILSISKITSTGLYVQEEERNGIEHVQNSSSFPSSSTQQNFDKNKPKEKDVHMSRKFEEKDVSETTAKNMSKLKQNASWVYEVAFSDEEKDADTEKEFDSAMEPESNENSFGLQQDSEEVHLSSLSLNGDHWLENDELNAKVNKTESSLPADEKPSVVLDGDAGPNEGRDNKPGKEKGGGSEERPYFVFYQSSDGQLLMVHPITMRCLVHHYGSYESLPSSIEAKVLELENVVQTDASRKRYRYLCHLPLTAHFCLCELDLTSLLPPSSLAPFADELRARELKRLNRAKLEAEENARAERKALKSQGPKPPSAEDFAAILASVNKTYPIIPTSNIDSEYPLPVSFSPTEFTSQASSPIPPTSFSSHSASPVSTSKSLFSSVTKLGYASAYDAPDLNTRKSPLPGTMSEAKGSWDSPLKFDSGSTSSSQFGFELPASQARPRPSPTLDSSQSNVESSSTPSGSKGKKNKKGTMLFSTSSARRY